METQATLESRGTKMVVRRGYPPCHVRNRCNGLSSGLQVFFLQEPFASGAAMQWPSRASIISTTHFLWKKCLRKLISDEVNCPSTT